MSREIKFRVWFKPTAKHKADFEDRYHHKLEDLSCSTYTQEDFLDDTWRNTDDYESIVFEQYTGLKDKNGKEIYDGDIIVDEYGFRYTIKFSEKRLAFVGLTAQNRGIGLYKIKTPYIIGNIHENGELLGDTNDASMGDNEELIKLIEQEENDGE